MFWRASILLVEEKVGPSTESECEEEGWKSEKKGKDITKSSGRGKNEWTKEIDNDARQY